MQGYRLSPQQRQLWDLEQDRPGNGAQCAVLLLGELDRGALRQALERAVERHEILRTTFHRRTGMKVPLQVVADRAEVSWEEAPAGGVPSGREGDLAARLLAAPGAGRLGGERSSLLDARLLALDAGRHVLALRLPALCADARSLANLVHEIAAGLSGAGAPTGREEGEEVVQYLQFSEWQNELLVDEESAAGREFWRGRSAASVSRLQLPFGSGRSEGSSFALRSVPVPLPPEAAARLRTVAAAAGAGVPAFLLTAWQLLLWRLTGREDVVVATMLDGRKFEELEGALGLFARAVPIHGRCDGDLGFGDALRRTQEALDEARAWQEYFAGDEAASAPAAPPAAFELTRWPGEIVQNGLRMSLLALRVAIEPFEVKLAAVDLGDRLDLEIQYDASVLGEEDGRCLAGQLAAVVAHAATAPETAAGDLDYLGEESRRALVTELNRTRAEPPAARSVHELFAAQAARTPGRPAVVAGGERLSYAELDARANRLAHRLAGLGVGPESRVALCLERSADLVVALLAVLKAGGAYVPLDPELPRRRLAALLAESGASAVVTQESLAGRLPQGAPPTVVLDREEDLQRLPEGDHGVHVAPQNLAYVLFTSGSTGQPKGVAVEHRQLLNYLDGVGHAMALPDGAGFAMVSSLAADLGNTAIFPTLCRGGCLYLPSQEEISDPEALAGCFAAHPVAALKIVPSHLSNLLSGERVAEVLPRELLVLGGEAASWDLIERVRTLAPGLRILNHYGPTETTVGATTYPVPPGAEPRGRALPLGAPLPNLRVYVLDPALRPVPVGASGELWIGGAGLSRGYLGRPAPTAARFLPDPFGAESGGRLYRTGDLARFQPDGRLEFLGRADHQVKVRGFRVELGEIEAALRRDPRVRDAVVLLREDRPGEPRLVAYVVPERGGQPSGTELRHTLQESLPEHMLPASFVSLEELPLTANGKVDRGALPAPDAGRDPASEIVPPRAFGEELLASLWRDLLRRPQVGVHDDFFALGGDSLQATQLVSRVRKAFEVELPVRSLFEAPTISELAVRIERAMAGGLDTLPIERVPRDGDLPLSFAQERLWAIHQMDPSSTAYNTTSPVRLDGPLDEAALVRTLDEIVRRHEILRTTFPSLEGRPAQRISPPGPLALRRIDLSHLPEGEQEAEVRRHVSDEADQPFDLAAGPLLRLLLLRLAEERHVILFTLHHIVTDGWSAGVLVRELTTLYDAFVHGRPSPLPELPIQYADFAWWQRRWLSGDVLDNLISYWRRQLTGVPETLGLPFDRPRPAVQTYRGDSVVIQRSPEVLQALKDLSRKEGVTLFMTLLAAFYALLHAYTEQEDLVVGIDVANRNRVEIEGLVGFFVNNLALRCDLSGDPTFSDLLKRVRTAALGAYAHQDLPFATVVKELQPKRSLSQTPLFQVLFVLQNTPPLADRPRDIEVGIVDTELKVSKFDLALFISETGTGLIENWTYSTELFEGATVLQMARHLTRLLEGVLEQPEAPLSQIHIFTDREREKRMTERMERELSNIKSFSRRRQTVDLDELELVQYSQLDPEQPMPLVIQPALGDVDLAGWAADNRETIDTKLRRHGALLFRGFGVKSVAEFERFAGTACDELFSDYGDLPREEEGGRVYHSTPYPEEKTILFHNESSHQHRWPSKQLFYCVTPAEEGGQTPIVDCRRMYTALPPDIVGRLAEKKLMYVRNFTEGLDVSWQEFFRTDDRARVEAYCTKSGMEFEWRPDGLRTRQVCPAVIEHPITGEMSFFNQIQLHHIACLEPEVREALLSLFTFENLPRNVLYGDGTPIEDSVVETVSELYWQTAVEFPWQAGDVILLDNMLTAHARRPFRGARKIVVAMGDMVNASEL